MTRFRLVKAFPWLGIIFRPWIISTLYEVLAFLIIYRRVPNVRRTGYFNDLLFDIKLRETDYVLRSFTSDKEFAKVFVRGIEGEDLSVETLAVLRNPDELGSYEFPDHCVIKPTHMSAEVIFHETGPISPRHMEKMQQWFRLNFGDITGEKNYQRLQPKIIVEPWLKLNGSYCNDYRLFVFDGKLTAIEIKVRQSEIKSNNMYLTPDWRLFPGISSYTKDDWRPEQSAIDALKPKCVARMTEIAENIGTQLNFVRVDFFSDGEQFFVGEISHVNSGLRETFDPVDVEKIFTSSAPGTPDKHM